MRRARDRRPQVLTVTLAAIAVIGLAVARITSDNPARRDLPGAVQPASPLPDKRTSPRHGATDRARIVELLFRRAVLSLQARDHEQAARTLMRLIALAPQMPEAHVNLGFARLGQGDIAAAQQAFHTAIALRPGQANAYWGLAVALERGCDRHRAIIAMERYIRLADPKARFLRRARSALWEWQAALDAGRSVAAPDAARGGSDCTPRATAAGPVP